MNTTQPEAAWKAIAWLSEQPQASSTRGMLAARRSILEQPDYVEKLVPGARAILPQLISMLEQPIPPRPVDNLESFYWLYAAIDTVLRDPKANLEQELQKAQQTTEQFLSCTSAGEKQSVCAKQVDPNFQGYLPEGQ